MEETANFHVTRHNIKNAKTPVLHQLLPLEKDIHYNLREQSHSLTLSSEDNNLIRQNFLHRMLFTDIY